MNLTKYEQETIINYNAGEQMATVYTADKAVMRKIDALVTEYPEIYLVVNETDISKEYSMPKLYVSYRKPRRLSNNRREQIILQMKRINEVEKCIDNVAHF